MEKKVAIYVRVSTADQAEEGYSIEEQIDKLKKFAEIRDWHVYDIYTDPGFSGSTMDRPALKRLIRDVRAQRVNVVLVYKLDRISRSQKDTLYLLEDVILKHKADFVSLLENFDTSTAFGKAMIGILAVFAQLDREQIAERMKMGKVGRARSGKPMGWTNPPFGYRYVEGEYHINEAQALIVQQIFQDYLAGISITKLRDKLNEEGHIGKDIPWSYRTIRQMLDNPVYAGQNQFKGGMYEGTHEPIISPEDYEKTQQELRIRQVEAYEKNNNPRPFQGKYLLSGILRCGYCGYPLNLMLGNIRKDGTRLKKYQCVNRYQKPGVRIFQAEKKCQSGFYYMEDLEEHVLAEIEKLRLDPSLVEELTEEEEDHTEIYLRRIVQVDKQLEKLSNLYMADMLTLEDMQIKAKSLQVERKIVLQKMEDESNYEKKAKKKRAIKLLEDMAVSIREEEQERQKIIVNSLVEKVDVTAGEINIRWKL